MRRNLIISLIGAVLFFLLSLEFLSWPGRAASSQDVAPVFGATPTATSSLSGPAQPATGMDPAIVAALIGLGGAIGIALVGGAFALYQMRLTAKSEQKRQEDQLRYDKERQEDQFRHDKEQQEKQRLHDEEMERIRRELDAQYKAKEQQEQQEATKVEALRLKMLQDQTNTEREKTYRLALHADPRIAYLQILDMSRPLEVLNVYVRVRVHQEARSSYTLDPALQAAEKLRDPNVLLQANSKYLEQRSSSAIDPDEAVRTHKRCVLVGDPGAGKTTLLKYLTLKAADQQLDRLPDLPIHIELNAFAASEYRDLLDFAAHQWDQRYRFPQSDARAYMETRMQAGQALLLLDALDETVIGTTPVEAEASYERISETILQVATRYPQVPIVVTARKAGYHQRSTLTGFLELDVLDFRQEEIQQFITNWFKCAQDAQNQAMGDDLWARLERNPRLQALAANPLLLSLIVLVYEAQLDLPERRAELYKRCVEILLTEWDARRYIRRRREFKPEHKRQLLAEVAWHFHQQGRRYFPEPEVLSVIGSFLPKVRVPSEQNGSILAEIANEQGLLKEQAKGWQGFLHLTLQEYFVAQYVTDHQCLDTLLAHRGDPWWEEVLLLYAGHTPDASPLMSRLLGEGDDPLQEDIFSTNLILAGRCLATKPTLQQVDLWQRVIDRLFEQTVTSSYALTQEQSTEALAAIGGKEVNERLVALLTEKPIGFSVRMSIADALRALGERSVAPQLVALLSDEQINFSVRMRMAVALGELGERSVAPQLVALLSDEQIDSDVRESIANALGELGECSVAPQLLPLLSDEQIASDVRGGIADALGRLGERSVAPQLVALLSDEQIDSFVRSRIADALGRLGECSAVPQLVALLSDKQIDSDVRIFIASALGDLGERSVVPQLVALLSDKQIASDVRGGIAAALGELGERSVAPQLVALLSDEQIDSFVRSRIADALGRLGERSVVPQLVALLSDEQINPDVRESIANALGRLGERSVVPQLVALLSDEQIDSDVRIFIASALGRLGKRLVVPQLLPLLSDEQIDSFVRIFIASALGVLGEHSVIPQLLPLLSDKQIDSSVRRQIAQTIGILTQDEATVSTLAHLLLTSDIADAIYHALWTVSRRVGVRIYLQEGTEGKGYQIVKW